MNWWFILLLALILLSGAVNGTLDNIDHHKGAMCLRDVWHLTKHADRMVLLLIGWVGLAKVPWRLHRYMICLAVVLAAAVLWEYCYTNNVYYWMWLDETWQAPSLGEWLDGLLGLDK